LALESSSFKNLFESIGLVPEQTDILKLFYDSLTSKGSLTWYFDADLCIQTGVYCDEDKIWAL